MSSKPKLSDEEMDKPHDPYLVSQADKPITYRQLITLLQENEQYLDDEIQVHDDTPGVWFHIHSLRRDAGKDDLVLEGSSTRETPEETASRFIPYK